MKDYNITNSKQPVKLEFVVQCAEEKGYRWRVVSRQELLNLNPHDIVDVYELGKPVKVGVSIQPK